MVQALDERKATAAHLLPASRRLGHIAACAQRVPAAAAAGPSAAGAVRHPDTEPREAERGSLGVRAEAQKADVLSSTTIFLRPSQSTVEIDGATRSSV